VPAGGGGCLWLASQLVSHYNLYRSGRREGHWRGWPDCRRARDLIAESRQLAVIVGGGWWGVLASVLPLRVCLRRVIAMAAARRSRQFGGFEFISGIRRGPCWPRSPRFRFKRDDVGRRDYPGMTSP